MMRFPLTQWMLHADSLPEQPCDEPEIPAFSLPGAAALSKFADLIGADEREESEAQRREVPYAIGDLFEAALRGEVTLSKEMDFGSFLGDRALLMFSDLLGSGEIYIGDACVAHFGGEQETYDMTGMPCSLCVDVSEALRLGRRETIRLRFDDARPAGVCGAAILSVTARAHLSRVSIRPDVSRRIMTVRARISAQQAGQYILRVQAVPGDRKGNPEPARETDIQLDAGEARSVQLALSVDAPVFVPGKPYAAPALKIQLFSRDQQDCGDGFLCDEALMMCGYPGAAPKAYLPLSQADFLEKPESVCRKIKRLGVWAVSGTMRDGLYRELSRAGIAVVGYVSEEIRPFYMRYPCLALTDIPLERDDLSLEEAAWQMTGSVSFPRVIDETMTKEELLLEASGKRLFAGSQRVQDTLLWLRTVQIRMRAEAARQGRYQGALCSAREIGNSDICDAIATAFAPIHLSALPLSGAWWTGTRFSASLEAFLPERAAESIRAFSILEDEDGTELARFEMPCKKSGYLGVIDAQLPDVPCVLALRCALLCGEETIEESVMPVYVGKRGPLEAAF